MLCKGLNKVSKQSLQAFIRKQIGCVQLWDGRHEPCVGTGSDTPVSNVVGQGPQVRRTWPRGNRLLLRVNDVVTNTPDDLGPGPLVSPPHQRGQHIYVSNGIDIDRAFGVDVPSTGYRREPHLVGVLEALAYWQVPPFRQRRPTAVTTDEMGSEGEESMDT